MSIVLTGSPDVAQGSAAWLQLRLGKVTASRIADMTARTKSGWGAARAQYMAQLIVERLTGAPVETFSSAAMAWGLDTEPEARRAYAFMADVDVVEAWFVAHPRLAMCGASPDGLVGEDGLVEFKCPTTATHLETLLSRQTPGKYLPQMQWQMACTGRSWCDFVSYDPRLPESLRLVVMRVARDDELIARLEEEVAAFLGEVEAKVDDLLGICGSVPVSLGQAAFEVAAACAKNLETSQPDLLTRAQNRPTTDL